MSKSGFLVNLDKIIQNARKYALSGCYKMAHENYDIVISDLDFFIANLADDSQREEWKKVEAIIIEEDNVVQSVLTDLASLNPSASRPSAAPSSAPSDQAYYRRGKPADQIDYDDFVSDDPMVFGPPGGPPRQNYQPRARNDYQQQPDRRSVPAKKKPITKDVKNMSYAEAYPDEYKDSETKKIIDQIESCKLDSAHRKITFNDIASLDDAKGVLYEAAILPMLLPNFFTGLRQPWKGILLFGPPGTGKSTLAQAVANESTATFFQVDVGLLKSHFVGDSEKLVSYLFKLARHYAPSIIFIDEIESLTSARGGGDESDADKKMKSQLLGEMDGVSSIDENGNRVQVTLIGATNCPEQIDDAIRRRLEKRVYVPLPDKEGRKRMFELECKNSNKIIGKDVDYEKLGDLTEGYSGSDIHAICAAALVAPGNQYIRQLTEEDKKNPDAVEKKLMALPVEMKYFEKEIQNCRPSVPASKLPEYKKFMEAFGAL